MPQAPVTRDREHRQAPAGHGSTVGETGRGDAACFEIQILPPGFGRALQGGESAVETDSGHDVALLHDVPGLHTGILPRATKAVGVPLNRLEPLALVYGDDAVASDCDTAGFHRKLTGNG
jgi:hypothetical protein